MTPFLFPEGPFARNFLTLCQECLYCLSPVYNMAESFQKLSEDTPTAAFKKNIVEMTRGGS